MNNPIYQYAMAIMPITYAITSFLPQLKQLQQTVMESNNGIFVIASVVIFGIFCMFANRKTIYTEIAKIWFDRENLKSITVSHKYNDYGSLASPPSIPSTYTAISKMLIEQYAVMSMTLEHQIKLGQYDRLTGIRKGEDKEYNCFFVENLKFQQIANDLYVEANNSSSTISSSGGNGGFVAINYNITLFSKHIDLKEFASNAIAKYEEEVKAEQNRFIYHFKYINKNEMSRNGQNFDELKFTTNILHKKGTPTARSFEHLFSENNEKLLHDITQIQDRNYYIRNGLQQKLSYLFYGPFGTGKTHTASIIAHETNRHVIEIPFSRINTNEEFEQLLNLTKINNIEFKHSEIILLFDEIDIDAPTLSKNDDDETSDKNKTDKLDETLQNLSASIAKMNEANDTQLTRMFGGTVKKNKTTSKTERNISISTVLTGIDGVGNYDGLIIIGITNNIEKLNQSLLREFRFTPMYFGYISRKNIANMITKYFNCTLTDEEIADLPNTEHEISPATIRYIINSQIENDYKTCLTEIANLKNKNAITTSQSPTTIDE